MTHYNITLIVMSYAVAVTGSLMALMITRDARLRPADQRRGLVMLASLCLGGVAIWSMHFIGMLAMDMKDMDISYNWWLTALSFVVGVGVVYAGLTIMTTGIFNYFKLSLAAILVGLGVTAMHYTGMLSMQIQADTQWNGKLIALSIVIAVGASIAALWLAVHIKRLWQMAISALIMGIAVCGMHYTGMAAVEFLHNSALPQVEPMSLTTSIFSLLIVLLDAVIVLLAMAQTMAEANHRKFTKAA
jgi:NO-binding membrane sensor protein with MHYT domain